MSLQKLAELSKTIYLGPGRLEELYKKVEHELPISKDTSELVQCLTYLARGAHMFGHVFNKPLEASIAQRLIKQVTELEEK